MPNHTKQRRRKCECALMQAACKKKSARTPHQNTALFKVKGQYRLLIAPLDVLYNMGIFCYGTHLGWVPRINALKAAQADSLVTQNIFETTWFVPRVNTAKFTDSHWIHNIYIIAPQMYVAESLFTHKRCGPECVCLILFILFCKWDQKVGRWGLGVLWLFCQRSSIKITKLFSLHAPHWRLAVLLWRYPDKIWTLRF